MSEHNQALWLRARGAELSVGTAPYTRAQAGEVVIRSRAVAVNPVDTMTGFQRGLVYPWLHYPAVLGTDVAGEVVEVAAGVDHLSVGDRVVGLATGQERHRNSPAHGAFQRLVVLAAATVSPIPEPMSYAEAAVLPLGLATAAAGLFEPEQLGLDLPTASPGERDQSVVVWGGSTSVGCNAIQLARAAGYRVLSTASPHNHRLVTDLGAELVVDHHDRSAVRMICAALSGHRLAGVLAIGGGSLGSSIRIAARAGGGRVASVVPGPVTAATGLVARLLKVRVSAIWGGTVARNAIGPAVFTDHLPAALVTGTHRPAPPPEIVGRGLGAIPEAIERLRAGVSARKLVVTLDH